MAIKSQLLTKEQVLVLCSFTEKEFDNFLYEHHIVLPTINENGIKKYDSVDVEKIMKARLGIGKTNTIKAIINETISQDNIDTQKNNIDEQDNIIDNEIDFEQLIKLKDSSSNQIYSSVLNQMGCFEEYNTIKDMPIPLKGGPNPISMSETREILGGITKDVVLKLVELQLIQYTYVVTGRYNCFKFESEEIKAKAEAIKQFLDLARKFKKAKRGFNSSELQYILNIDLITYKRWVMKGLLVPTKTDPTLFSLDYVSKIVTDKENLISKDYSLLVLDEVKTILGITSRNFIETYITKGLLTVKKTLKIKNTIVLLFDRQQVEQIGYMGLGLSKKDCTDLICINTDFIENELHIREAKFWRWVDFGVFEQPIISQLGFKFYNKDYLETIKKSFYLSDDTIGTEEVKNLLGISQEEWLYIIQNKIYDKLIKYNVGTHRYLYSQRNIETNKAEIMQLIEKRREKREVPTISYTRTCALLHISLVTLQDLVEKHNISPLVDETGCTRIPYSDFETISKIIKKNQEEKEKQQEEIKKCQEEKKQYENYIYYADQAIKWNLPAHTVYNYCHYGKIPGAIKIRGRWKIPKDAKKPDFSVLQNNNSVSNQVEKSNNMCSTEQKAKEWNIDGSLVRKYCRDGRIEGAQKIDNIWYIPNNSVKPTKPKLTEPPEGMCFASQKAKEWGLSVATVQKYCHVGKIEGAYKLNEIWVIPKDSLRPINKNVVPAVTSECEKNESIETIISTPIVKPNMTDTENIEIIENTENLVNRTPTVTISKPISEPIPTHSRTLTSNNSAVQTKLNIISKREKPLVIIKKMVKGLCKTFNKIK